MKTRHALKVLLILCLFPVGSALAQTPSLLNYQGRVSVNGTNFHGTGQFKFALVDGGVDQTQQATATRNIFNGVILNIFVNFGGSGYTSVPEVHIIDSTGSGAEAIAQIGGGAVTNVEVIAVGSNYSPDTIVVIDPPAPDMVVTTFWSNDGTSVDGSEPAAAVSLPVQHGLYSVLLGDDSLSNMDVLSTAVFNNPEVYLRAWFNDGVQGFQQLTPDQRVAAVAYALQAGDVPDGVITGDKLAPGAVADNLEADGQSAVPFGALVLSETAVNASFTDAGYVNVGTVQTGNTWEEANPFTPPETRGGYTMIWTGSELIVWGGVTSGVPIGVGRRHNPTNNFWSALSNVNAPSARRDHTAVWTGSEMIVWGGWDITDFLNTGARYNPANNTWTAMTTNNAPPARSGHTAIWTGTEMIVWGGGPPSAELNSGGRYNPATDTWTATSFTSVPSARRDHTAVWTGSEMIIWGGAGIGLLNTGGRYNPVNNTWTNTSTSSAPSARLFHTAVWTGDEMIVWGGQAGTNRLATGGRYNPVANAWASDATAIAGAPAKRGQHSALWTGTRMIIWGGEDVAQLNTGGIYTPVANTWSATSQEGAPPPSGNHTAVWTGNEMRVWGVPLDIPSLWTYRPGRVMHLFMRP